MYSWVKYYSHNVCKYSTVLHKSKYKASPDLLYSSYTTEEGYGYGNGKYTKDKLSCEFWIGESICLITHAELLKPES